MRIRVEQAIFEKFPGARIGVIAAMGIANAKPNLKIAALLRDEEKKQQEALQGKEMGQLPEVKAWRGVYDAFGSPHADFRSSVEALLRRVRAGKPLPAINNLVDLYNALSIRHHIPVGAEDLDAVQGDIELGFADGTESGIYLGSTEPENCYPGEVVYRDDGGFLCRRWNWREADRTKITPETSNAVIVMEQAPGMPDELLDRALADMRSLVAEYLGGTQETVILNNGTPEWSFAFTPSGRVATGKPSTAAAHKPAIPPRAAAKKEQPKQAPKPPKAPAQLPTGGRKRDVALLLKAILAHMGITDVMPTVTRPEQPGFGDYATGVAMQVSGRLQRSPITIVTEMKDLIETAKQAVKANQPSHILYQIGQTVSEKEAVENILRDLDRAEVAFPGFLNLFFSEASLSTLVRSLPKLGNGYGTRRPEPENSYRANSETDPRLNRRITVEFTDPNPLKEFHVGHVYSNTVGESISRILEANGATVRRVCYQGDVGMHVAKSLWGLKQKFETDGMTIAGLADLTLAKRVAYLGAAYAMGAEVFETDEAAKKEMERINALVYISMQDYLMKEQAMTRHVDYRASVSVDETELAWVASTYLICRQWSLEYFDRLYERLGTHFEKLYFESFVGERGWKIVHDHLADGIFTKSEGAIVYQGEKKGLHTRVFVNALGLPTYEAKELGLAVVKEEDWPADLSVIVTGKEIDEYFRVLLSAIADIAPQLAAKTRHVSHGMIRLPTGKMSSRTGKVLSGIWLFDETKREIYNILNSNRTNYTKEEQEEIAEKAAVAAVKYSLLRVALPMDIVFDIQKNVSFDGDSGPYLLYANARINSVLRKADWNAETAMQQELPSSGMTPEERAVARLILQYPDHVAEAGESLSPNGIAQFAFQLASAFNLFYNTSPIIGSEREAFRLALTAATGQVLTNALHLLGIRTVERM